MSAIEINSIVDISKLAWRRRAFIVKTVLVFLVLGVFQIVSTPVQYKSRIILMPQASSAGTQGLAGLGQIAGLAGLNLNYDESGGGISPDLFPEILNSQSFFLEFMGRRFPGNNGEPVEIKDLFSEFDSRPLVIRLIFGLLNMPSTIKGLFSDHDGQKLNTTLDQNGILRLTKEENRIVNKLKNVFEIEVKAINGLIVISSEMPDPVLAAESVQFAKNYLTDYIKDYKTGKDKKNLDFLNGQLANAKEEYIRSQEKLAKLRDRNQNLISVLARNEEERLQSEYDLAFSVYQNLSQQVVQAKITLEKNSPIFTILEPAQVPLGKDSPKSSLIVFVSIFLGIMTAMAYLLFDLLVLTSGKGSGL